MAHSGRRSSRRRLSSVSARPVVATDRLSPEFKRPYRRAPLYTTELLVKYQVKQPRLRAAELFLLLAMLFLASGIMTEPTIKLYLRRKGINHACHMRQPRSGAIGAVANYIQIGMCAKQSNKKHNRIKLKLLSAQNETVERRIIS